MSTSQSLDSSQANNSSIGEAAAAAEQVPRDEALRELYSAVELLPADRKAAFVKARQVCPHLVDAESDGMLFLRNERFNYWKAAESLAAYWEERRNIFGEDRWTLALTQTGNGALSQDDIFSIHSGMLAILPKTNKGQSVLLVDRARALAQATSISKIRAAFYILSKLCRADYAQTKGILCFSMLVTPRVSSLDHRYVNRALKMAKVFPIKIHLHILNSPPKTKKNILAEQVLTAGLAFASAYFGRFQVITEKTGHDILRNLKSLGLQSNGIPTALGGRWKYESFMKWCREETCREYASTKQQQQQRQRHPSNDSSGGDESSGHTDTNHNDGEEKLRKAESKRDRIRRLNVIHSRQKRERRKAEQMEMQSNYETLLKQHHLLVTENIHLENLWSQAQALVEHYSSSVHETKAAAAPYASKGTHKESQSTDMQNLIASVLQQSKSG